MRRAKNPGRRSDICSYKQSYLLSRGLLIATDIIAYAWVFASFSSHHKQVLNPSREPFVISQPGLEPASRHSPHIATQFWTTVETSSSHRNQVLNSWRESFVISSTSYEPASRVSQHIKTKHWTIVKTFSSQTETQFWTLDEKLSSYHNPVSNQHQDFLCILIHSVEPLCIDMLRNP
jgi:hypothetical protein